MSKDKLFFEGFLQKRKDKMKIRWAKYWFRLQNTTLFFYTQKNGIASHLRGYYYIYTVQSVREVPTGNNSSRGFIFEIIMTSGKRKVLAADTAALRTEWVGHLWEAMYLSTSVLTKNTHPRECEQRDRGNSLAPACSYSDSETETEAPPARPRSAPIAPRRSFIDGTSADSDDHIYGNTLQCHDGESVDGPQPTIEGGTQEGDYDVLPARNRECDISPEVEDVEEGIYDVPLSSKEVEDQDNIYDVPTSLLSEVTAQSIGEKLNGGACWRI